jgi:hypothetical protein
MTGLFFFITRKPQVYAKLVKEIIENFESAGEIGSGADLMAKCEYLRVCRVFEGPLTVCY